jgi:hypothetical protein
VVLKYSKLRDSVEFYKDEKEEIVTEISDKRNEESRLNIIKQ